MTDLQQKQRRAYYKSRYQKDYTLLIGVILSAVFITAFVFLFARAIDIWAVNTCVDFNDCEAVYSSIR